jgi:hypothetical protein
MDPQSIEEKTIESMQRDLDMLNMLKEKYPSGPIKKLLDTIYRERSLALSTYKAPIIGEAVQDSSVKLTEAIMAESIRKDKIIFNLEKQISDMRNFWKYWGK